MEVLASLLKQLCQSQSSLPQKVGNLYEKYKKYRSRPSTQELCHVLEAVVGLYTRVFFVIDALDEAPSSYERSQLLTRIASLQKKNAVNLVATSRPLPSITHHFKDSLSLEIYAAKNDTLIYLENHMDQLPSFVQDCAEWREVIKMAISEAIAGMFLLTRIYLDFLEDKLTIKDMDDALAWIKNNRTKSIGNTNLVLNSAYDTAMERIDTQKPGLRAYAIQVLSWITCAKSPLTVLELQHALATEKGKQALDPRGILPDDEIVSACAGLVTIDKNSRIIRLTHYTTKTYLENKRQRWFPEADTSMAAICMTYISFSVFNSGPCPSDVTFGKRMQLYPFYRYASCHWGHHIREATSELQVATNFFISQAQVEAASQAAFVRLRYSPLDSQKYPRKRTNLHLAALFGIDHLARSFLHGGAPDLSDSYGRTPLSLAAEAGHGAIVKLLVDHGADVNFKDNNGAAPLIFASRDGHKAVVKLLLEYGADPDTQDNDNRTPLNLAAEACDDGIGRLLFNHGAGSRAKPDQSRAPLSLAAQSGSTAMVKLLLEEGVDCNPIDEYHRTPLIWAAMYGYEDIAELLLEKGANLYLKDDDRKSPMSLAIKYGHRGIVQLLLKKGNLNPKGRGDRTWVDVAWAG